MDYIVLLIRSIPIVSLDKVYLNDSDAIYLDCTRLDGSNELVSRYAPSKENYVASQIENISIKLNRINQNKIILVDDVVFSGGVLKRIIDLFKKYNIEVIGIIGIISSEYGYNYFNSILPKGLKCSYLMDDKVIDQICERDFYFGIAQSGISVKINNEIFKAPYFLPYGDPCNRASIPKENEIEFSKGCIKRSIMLWEEIERLSNSEIYMKDLKEIINYTNKNDRVVKILKKEFDKYE